MEKSCHSSGGGDSTATSGSTNSRNSSTTDVYLKHLNKLSHKVCKPNRRQSSPTVDPQSRFNQAAVAQSQPLNSQQQQLQQQPPVYTINKNDFRDVVQRLTGSPAGSPAREAFSSPPPLFQHPKTKPSSSRLQKIRPPPLAQISNRPPDLLNYAAGPNQQQFPPPNFNYSFGSSTAPSSVFPGGQRQPLSPLPPFPTVHGAAESPVSAYMRFLQNSFAFSPATDTELKKFPPISPRWNNVAPPPPRLNQMPPPPPFPSQQQQNIPPPPPPQNSRPPLTGAPPFPAFPSSPLPFGCLNSPGMFSPSLLFSPTGQLGFPQLPLSPTVPVPSPRWRGH